MLAFILSLISIILFVIGMIKPDLALKFINKDNRSRKNVFLVFGIAFVLFFITMLVTVDSVDVEGNNISDTEEISEREYKSLKKKLEKYEWGSKLAPILKEMGVKKIRNIQVDSDENTGIIYGVKFTADNTELKTHPIKNSDG